MKLNGWVNGLTESMAADIQTERERERDREGYQQHRALFEQKRKMKRNLWTFIWEDYRLFLLALAFIWWMKNMNNAMLMLLIIMHGHPAGLRMNGADADIRLWWWWCASASALRYRIERKMDEALCFDVERGNWLKWWPSCFMNGRGDDWGADVVD